MGAWANAAGRQAVPPILDWRELARPWKLFSFAVGTALMVVGVFWYRISDWDVGISLLMPLLTYLTAPWVVRVLVRAHLRHLPLAAFWAWFTIDGAYWFYHTMVGNEMLRVENARTSAALYFGMGCFWLPRASLREILAILRRHARPLRLREAPPSRPPLGFAATMLAFGVGALLWSLLVEPLFVEVTRHRIGVVDAARPPVRVLQLSDLHLSRFGWREAKVLRLAADLRPDLIVLSGDYLERPDDLPGVLDFFTALPKVPKLAVTGTWERWSGIGLPEFMRAAAERGVRFLNNESTVVHTPAGALRVTGLDDAYSGQPDWAKATRTIPAAERLPHLVLEHAPGYRDTLSQQLGERRERAPLAMLSGHTHGGQVDLFGWWRQLPPGSGDYAAGWYREGPQGRYAVPLYVSRGIGVSVLPLRFGVRPEITLFEVGR